MTVTTPPGEVLRDEAGMRLEFVRSYHGSPEEVWAALTEPDHLARWFGIRTGDPATGKVELALTGEADSTPQTIVIVECDPPARLVVDVPSPDGTWPLSVSIGVLAGVTTLVFTHRLVEPYDASNIGPGWHYYLDRLGAVIADTTVPDNWDDYYPSLRDVYTLSS